MLKGSLGCCTGAHVCDVVANPIPSERERAAKAAQHARQAIGLTAHVIETGKRCRPRALAGPAAVEGSSGGFGGAG